MESKPIKIAKQPNYQTEIIKTATPLIHPAQFFVGFLKWWYVDSITKYLRFLKRFIELLFDRLSIILLIKTFFVPWHRFGDIFGIAFGIVMRLLWLPVALSIVLLSSALILLFIGLWLVLPIITIYNVIFFWL